MMSDFDKLRAELRRQNFAVAQTKNGHWRADAPGGAGCVHFSESEDPRAIKNTVSDLRKVGFEWPPPVSRRNGAVGVSVEPVNCPACGRRTFDVMAGECSSEECRHEPDLDEVYQRVKAAKELLAAAEDELKLRNAELLKAQEARDRAAAQRTDLSTSYEVLKQKLVKKLGEP